MQADTLRKILDNREAARPVVLATNLTTGAEELLYPVDGDGNPALMDAARAATPTAQCSCMCSIRRCA